MTPAQAELYKTVKKQTFVALDGDMNNELFVKSALARLSMLQKVTLWPALLGSDAESGKLQWLLDFYHDTNGQFVVFTKSRTFALSLSELMHGGASIVGGQDLEYRQSLIDKFDSGHLRFLVGTIQAMGESVNLQKASDAIFVDIHPSTIKMDQARDRIYRIGSGVPVRLYYLVTPGTADMTLLESNQKHSTEKELVFEFMRHIRS
jgi:superfamily II DNA or RNA helicase